MDRTLATLTALLLDPFLTVGEAEREAAAHRFAVPAPSAMPPRPHSGSTDKPEAESTSFASW
jgi:hypothetical protein